MKLSGIEQQIVDTQCKGCKLWNDEDGCQFLQFNGKPEPRPIANCIRKEEKK